MKYNISIIMPVFNVDKYIKTSLDSIVNQTIGLENLEVIMVDDCSTDKSGEIIDEYASKYSNFKAIHLTENSGAAGKPRNIGLKNATSEYVMFLDPDDYYEDNACEILYEKITHEDVDIVFGKYGVQSEKKVKFQQIGLDTVPELKFLKADEELKLFKLPSSIWTKIYKRNFIEKNEVNFPEEIPGQDLVFMVHALIKANGIIFIDKKIANYRVRDDSITSNRSTKNILGYVKAYEYVYKICMDNHKENVFSAVIESNLIFWLKKLILSDLDLTEKKIALRSSHMLFEKYHEYGLNPDEKELLPIINDIVDKQYENAISIANLLIDSIKSQDGVGISKNYKISVIIPIYNVEEYIGECLDSIVNQTIGIENIEVIIVNDCTPDNSMAIVREYALKYPSIKIIEHETNQGPGPSRNTGLNYVTSDYISFIDSDDFISENTYEITLSIAKNYHCDLVIYPYYLYDEYGRDYPKDIHHEIFKKEGLIEDIKSVPEIIFSTSPCNKVYSNRLSSFMNFPSILYEDNVTSAEILFNAKNIYLTDQCDYYYRKRESKNSITQKITKEKCFDLINANILLHDLIITYPEFKEMVQWINLHFADRNILNWMFLWDFSDDEIEKIFNGLKSFLSDIPKGSMDKFNDYFPDYNLIRTELILDIKYRDFSFFMIKWFNRSDQSTSLLYLLPETEVEVKTTSAENQKIASLTEDINDLTSKFYEMEYLSGENRSFSQRFVSRFPSLYMLFNVNETGLRNVFVNMRGFRSIKKNGLFDVGFYLKSYPSVRLSGMDPVLHYLYHGFKEGKKPSPDFDGDYYFKVNGDVKKSNLNPLVHYSLYGKNEIRKIPNPKYKISIIVPVYNVEKYIRDTLDSIVNQTIGLENLEVIVLDDCSTDSSGEIIDEYASKYSNFKAIHLNENSGAAGKPRNIGIEMATGEYLMFIDHDDYYTCDACEILYNKIVEENVDVVFSNYIYVFDDRKQKNWGDFGNLDQTKVKTIDEDPRLLALPPSVWTKIYKRDFILKTDIRFKNKLPNEDLIFVLNTFLEANGIVYLKNHYSYNFRVRDSEGDQSLSRGKTKENLRRMIQGYNETFKILKGYGKESYFATLFMGHLQFWSDNFILSDTTDFEKKELLKDIGPLFEEFKKYNGKPIRRYLIPLFESISNKDYKTAILLTDSLKDILKNTQKLEKDVHLTKNKEKELAEFLTTKGYLKYKSKNIANRTFNKFKKKLKTVNTFKKFNSWNKYRSLTVILPYRKTNDNDREMNLDITLKYLSQIGIFNIIISEHSDLSFKKELMDGYAHLFKSFRVFNTNSNGTLFNKAKSINRGVIESETPYIVICDIDCLTKKKNIDQSLKLLKEGYDVVHPFNRKVKDIIEKEKFQKNYDFNVVDAPEQERLWADGGIVFWNKLSFIQIGMKNEYFNGWGGEDNEIMIRADLFQLKQYRINDTLYHLYHYRPQKRTQNNVEQLQKIQKIKNKNECLNEISTWPWTKKAKERFYAGK